MFFWWISSWNYLWDLSYSFNFPFSLYSLLDSGVWDFFFFFCLIYLLLFWGKKMIALLVSDHFLDLNCFWVLPIFKFGTGVLSKLSSLLIFISSSRGWVFIASDMKILYKFYKLAPYDGFEVLKITYFQYFNSNILAFSSSSRGLVF